MIIDLHLHTSEFSTCSNVSFKEIISEASRKGLDGICITDHDNMLVKKILDENISSDLLVIVGIEVLTEEGDILVFGVSDLPKEKISVLELVNLVSEKGGVSIAAHPFRNNNRGIKDLIKDLENLDIIEGFNGNTCFANNLEAVKRASLVNKPIIGASDAHNIRQVGCFATFFSNPINNESDLIKELLKGNVRPVFYNEKLERYEEIKENN